MSGALTAFVFNAIYAEGWIDLEVYREGGAAVLRGTPVYDLLVGERWLRFTYSPFAAMLFTPLALVGMEVAVALWVLISILALEAVIWILVGRTGVKRRGRRANRTLLVVVAVLPLYPVMLTLWNGQIGIILLLVTVVDLTHGNEKWRGVATGVAAGVKVTALIFIPYLLVTRRFRAALMACLGFLGTVGLGFLLLPADSRDYWGGAFFDTQRVVAGQGADFFNQSLRGVLMLMPGSWPTVPLWLALCAVVGAGGLLVAAWASKKVGELAGITACAIVGLLVSPVSWPHHWVWCVPLLVLWAQRARRVDARLEKVGVAFLWLVFLLPGYIALATLLRYPSHAGMWLIPLTGSYVLSGLSALLALAVYFGWSDRRGRRGSGDGYPVSVVPGSPPGMPIRLLDHDPGMDRLRSTDPPSGMRA
ncbi:glycosyltransferase 87 family protein [Sphaerisporangium sp. TRM90804]|uniref:glycosyltransferase 87 family protein n=1 Tax=Sphaerisporangium sp. TRM90804 TaxID=3031113 RepID=UPI00244C5846|nr:glycosyltransferase 87 family protein [Sphaerisporangium sp. TRM90804]MDH2427111.1 glycosyltransferase 87 family protein [Sphaerisporangium sp. TRM90804]